MFDDDDSASEDSEDKEVPVRVLTEFTLYERGTRRIIPFEELLSKSDQLEANNYGASGQVWKWVEKDEDDNSNADDENEVEDLEENSEAVIKLTVILEVNVHNVEESESDEFMLDPYVSLFPFVSSIIFISLLGGFGYELVSRGTSFMYRLPPINCVMRHFGSKRVCFIIW